MDSVYYVDIKDNIDIKFPKKCVVCGRECDELSEIRGNPDISYWGGWKYLLGGTNHYKIFVHEDCSKYLKSNLRLRNFLLFGLAALAIPVVFYFDLNRLFLLIIVFAISFPALYWQVKNPPPIEFAKNDDMIEFTLKNENYAKEFARINGVYVKQ